MWAFFFFSLCLPTLWTATGFLYHSACYFNCDTYCGWIRYVMILEWHYLMWMDNDLILNTYVQCKPFRIPQFERESPDWGLTKLYAHTHTHTQIRINSYFQFILKLLSPKLKWIHIIWLCQTFTPAFECSVSRLFLYTNCYPFGQINTM